jgi:hypothetical protein
MRRITITRSISTTQGFEDRAASGGDRFSFSPTMSDLSCLVKRVHTSGKPIFYSRAKGPLVAVREQATRILESKTNDFIFTPLFYACITTALWL